MAAHNYKFERLLSQSSYCLSPTTSKCAVLHTSHLIHPPPLKMVCHVFKMGQIRPLFVYFRSFHMTNIAEI